MRLNWNLCSMISTIFKLYFFSKEDLPNESYSKSKNYKQLFSFLDKCNKVTDSIELTKHNKWIHFHFKENIQTSEMDRNF